MRESEKISTQWRKARLRLDLGQKEFAERLGVGAGYISEIESGKKEPSYTLAELFRFVCQEDDLDDVPITPIKRSTTQQHTSEEEIEMLKDEVREAYKQIAQLSAKIIERDDHIFELQKLLGKPLPLGKKKSI